MPRSMPQPPRSGHTLERGFRSRFDEELTATFELTLPISLSRVFASSPTSALRNLSPLCRVTRTETLQLCGNNAQREGRSEKDKRHSESERAAGDVDKKVNCMELLNPSTAAQTITIIPHELQAIRPPKKMTTVLIQNGSVMSHRKPGCFPNV